jgi:aminodeoxyfutalosine synthase
VARTIDDLSAKLEAGEPLTDADVDMLAGTRDIIAIGMLANSLRRKIHGPTVTFVRVLDLNLPPQRWPDEVPGTAGEVRIFQTPHSLEEAVRVVEDVRRLAGTTPVSAFCLFELSKLSEGLPVVLPALRRAGLELITQAPIDRLKAPERMLESLADAGLHLARLTVDGTPDRPWPTVCREVATLQNRLRTIRVFAPLPRQIDPAQPTTGYEDVKRIAICRLVADNVDTVQVDWALYGPKLAQVALTFGADDIDSVAAEDDDSKGRRRSPSEEIRRSIRAAGFEPAERDARFARRG